MSLKRSETLGSTSKVSLSLYGVNFQGYLVSVEVSRIEVNFQGYRYLVSVEVSSIGVNFLCSLVSVEGSSIRVNFQGYLVLEEGSSIGVNFQGYQRAAALGSTSKVYNVSVEGQQHWGQLPRLPCLCRGQQLWCCTCQSWGPRPRI